jgi:5-methylcytosine-specific restriction endonuclease McrA
MARPRGWTDNDLADAIASSRTYKEAIIALGLYPGNKMRERVRDRARELGLDTSHFVTGRQKSCDPFVYGVEFNTTTKRRFLAQTKYECSICGISEWLGERIILQVDHADGDRKNNRLDNLRLLCPNCHSQTPTWSRKKSKQ